MTRTHVLAFIAGCLLTTASVAGSSTISGPARVIDADTVVVNGTTVRLKGVDAAERGTPPGDEATEVMRGIINGSALTCHLTGERTHRREVGYCTTAAGVDINREIIAMGLALACPRYDARYMADEQAAALAVQPRASYCAKR
jgi:endonuclease YncB( thermonuclease family)